jgi:NADP-dependent alcohol dehydrogenase
MENFVYHNPVKIVFGKGSIAQLGSLIPAAARVLITYGGGSIKRNGVYDQVCRALGSHRVCEFSGIEPNPRYETCMRAVALARAEKTDFLLAVGGGSVLDGTKFIAAAIPYSSGDPWEIVSQGRPTAAATPLGCVLTLPATGSEMNGFAVISRDSTQEKLAFSSPHIYPQFSIMDPETTYSLPPRQVANGIVDAFVHVAEQYLTSGPPAPLQDRQAEAILATLIEQAPKVRSQPQDYDTRANLMWCATQALNGLIGCGVTQDWSTHMIGHELTALYGIDHAQSLAIVLPAAWRNRRAAKAVKLAQFGRRVWGLHDADGDALVEGAIARTQEFFEAVGVPTHLAAYGIAAAEAADKVSERLRVRGAKLGEGEAILPDQVRTILQQCG